MSMQKKHIAILGSTGSIGTQALEVIAAKPDLFEAEVLTAQNNAGLLIRQAIQFRPNAVVISNKDLYSKVDEALAPYNIKVYAGEEALKQIVAMESLDTVLVALVGFAGVEPTLQAIKARKRIALANKETLVAAGGIVQQAVLENRTEIIPVDSEHSAIFQCLAGEDLNPVEKVILTASGGPFRGKDRAFLRDVGREEALDHPNWEMGCKITIDSATLMNKGLEVIEAKWLFNLEPRQIEVIIHPQSIVHSLVQFEDGSLKAQMGLPDMKLPIQYALSYPRRISSEFKRFSFADYPKLTFEAPDLKNFRNLALAFEVLLAGGNKACILNAANEVAVSAFLKDRLGFLDISTVIEKCLQDVSFIKDPTLEDLILSDKESRRKAQEFIKSF
ncbi:MAG: 1-deoxy-D-xylulose-5-phosphate reductoisomerase [Bacteroidota bacterium]|nr:1-deoxy-D-xylulose-5-phosphate reductoisomerase [Bacteroidota bacterium]